MYHIRGPFFLGGGLLPLTVTGSPQRLICGSSFGFTRLMVCWPGFAGKWSAIPMGHRSGWRRCQLWKRVASYDVSDRSLFCSGVASVFGILPD